MQAPRKGFFAGLIALTAIAAAAAPFGGVVHTRFGILIPPAVLLSAGAQAAVATLLVARYGRRPSRGTAILAGAFAMESVLAIVQLLTVPFGTIAGAVLRVNSQASLWAYVLSVSTFASSGLLYAFVRSRPLPALRPRDARWYLAQTLTLYAAAALFVVAAPFTLATHLPPLVAGNDISPLRNGLVGPLALALCLAATFVAAVYGRTRIDRALALSLFAVTVSVALTLVGPHRFSIPWYAGRALHFVAPLFVLVMAIRLSLRKRPDPDSDATGRQAQRMETVWRLASSAFPEDAAFLQALVEEGSRAVRADAEFNGLICSEHGDELVIEVAYTHALGAGVPVPGDRYPMAGSLTEQVLRRGRSISWADIRREPRLTESARRRNEFWRAVIASPFRVGPRRYVIVFMSSQPLHEAFAPIDAAYVETLASLCVARLQQRAQANRLRYQTEHDALTGIFNRATFRSRAFAALSAQRRVALIVADLDFFREVNDTHGHQVGDALLVEVAAALVRVARSRKDIVARLGGDSFGILLFDAADRATLDRGLAEYILALQPPMNTGDREGKVQLGLKASFGVALAPDDAADFETLLAHADSAVLAAKDAGRGRVYYYDASAGRGVRNAARMHGELLEAIAQHQLVLEFQPHIELATGRVSGAEALVRWNHPERGFLPPAEFVPFAESHGLSSALGDWVMREAVLRSATWRAAYPDLRIWFNLSPDELIDPTLPARIGSIDGSLANMGVEITETAAMRDIDATVRAIGALRERGIAVALDDFGTGYSSLAALKRLPLDVVKIDRAFIAGLPTGTRDIAIIEAVISIAASCGFETVAEGVEQLAQIAFLASVGCTHGQGFVYAHPMPAEAFDRWLPQRGALAAPSRL